MIEVKGGGIEISTGRWFSTDRNGERHSIKNPFEQAKSSKHALLRYLKSAAPELAKKISFAHAVVFPDVSFDAAYIAPDSPREIIIDRNDLLRIAEALDRVFSHWNSRAGPNTTERNRIRALLSPTVSVRPRLRDVVSDTEVALLRLTQEQIGAMQCVRRNRRLIILGGAGTGKTILATERAIQLAQEGNKTLLVCFNRPLADHLSAVTQTTKITVETFHSLCARLFEKAGLAHPQPQDTVWWATEAASLLVDCCGTEGLNYDAILIDEAQDFHEDWLDALFCVLSSREDSVFLVYGDSHQTLWERGWGTWLAKHNWMQYELITNCRNTHAIARQVASVFGEPVTCNGPAGSEPVFHSLDVRSEGIEPVLALIGRAIGEEGLQPQQIAVLTSTRELAAKFRERFVYDLQFGPVGTNGAAVADTIHRFKGLEAALVVVVFGPDVLDGEADELRSLKYVAYSRASAILHVFGPKSFKK
jgi:hypothetical protein